MPHEGMVDALREARRVLKPDGVLIDVRPVTIPMVVEVVTGAGAIWAKAVASCGTPEDVAAADAAVRHALSGEWFAPEKRVAYDFEVYCDSAEDLSLYARNHKLPEGEIPYQELEERRNASDARGQRARLRFRRPWMLTTYRKI